MNKPRRRRVDTSERACVSCQQRKTRCIFREGRDVCEYCIRAEKTCVVRDRVPGTPLTRKNLDAAENRCKELEALLADLEARAPLQSGATSHSFTINEPNEANFVQPDVSGDPQSSQAGGSQDSYDWEEEPTLEEGRQNGNAPDGMASSQQRTGYHGLSSASALLQTLSSALSPASSNPKTLITSNDAQAQVPRSSDVLPGLIYSAGINSSVIQAHFVNIYFQTYNASYPILHESTFRKQLQRTSDRQVHSIFQIIYYMVLAIGEWITGHAAEDHSMYYDAARSRLRFEILETGNTSVVQAFLLLGNYLQKRDRPNTAYNFIGIAYRVALGLGLHREPRRVEPSKLLLVQHRRKLFWTLYCFDSGFSLTTGRPTLISDTFIDTKKPKNIDDSSIEARNFKIQEVDYPTTCSTIIAQSRLATIANKIHNTFLSVRSSQEVIDSTMTMEQSINNWRDSLPVYFFQMDVPQWFLGPRQIVLWKEANLRIILLLASQRNASEDEDKIVIGTKCQSTAVSTIYEIATFCETRIELVHVGLNWYAVYFILHAVLALAFQRMFEEKRTGTRVMIHEKESACSAWDTTIVRARQCLEMLRGGNKAASRTLQIFDRLQESFRSTSQIDHAARSNAPARNTSDVPERMLEIGTQQYAPSCAVIPQESTTSRAHNGLPPSMPSGVSPDVLFTDSIMNEWLGTADPSLHMYLDDETVGLDSMFQGFEGFPSVMEPENFAYTTNTMQARTYTPST